MTERPILDWSKPLPEYAFLPREGTTLDPMVGMGDLIQELLSKTGQKPQTPLMMGSFCEILHVHYDNILVSAAITKKGHLAVRDRKVLVIYISGRDCKLERRITLAHELGHIFFHYLDTETDSIKPVVLRSDFTKKGEEDFCEAFAHELLGPEIIAHRLFCESKRKRKLIRRAYRSCQLSLGI